MARHNVCAERWQQCRKRCEQDCRLSQTPVRGLPRARSSGELADNERPVVERSRVKIRPVRPHQRVHLRIQSHLREYVRIPQRPIQLTRQHGREVNRLPRTVRELHSKRMYADTSERFHPVERMAAHEFIVAEQSAGPADPTATCPSLSGAPPGEARPRLQRVAAASAGDRRRSSQHGTDYSHPYRRTALLLVTEVGTSAVQPAPPQRNARCTEPPR